MTHPPHGDRCPDRTERIIDSLLDGDLSHGEAREALHNLHGEARACEELARLRLAVARLRSPVESPDFSGSILLGMHARRGFLPRRARRVVTVGRVAVAAGLVVVVGLASFLHRNVPQLRLNEGASPVSRVVRTTGLTPEEQPVVVDRAVETIQASIASPVSRLSLSPRFRPEERLRFGTDDVGPRTTGGSAGPTVLALGAPEPMGVVGAAARTGPTGPAEAGSTAQAGTSPFLGRFGSLLVILREPPTTIDTERPVDDR